MMQVDSTSLDLLSESEHDLEQQLGTLLPASAHESNVLAIYYRAGQADARCIARRRERRWAAAAATLAVALIILPLASRPPNKDVDRLAETNARRAREQIADFPDARSNSADAVSVSFPQRRVAAVAMYLASRDTALNVEVESAPSHIPASVPVQSLQTPTQLRDIPSVRDSL